MTSPGQDDDAALAAVWTCPGTRTSAGISEPGVLRLPAAEAAGLVGERLAVYYGAQPPDGADQPPTVAEVDEFLAAFAADPPAPHRDQVIDRLLDLRGELAP
jgi:hypothetical protein